MLALMQPASGTPTWVALSYLAASVLFILGLKGLTHPRTAVRGNLLGALGMLVAIVVTLVHQQVLSNAWVLGGMSFGAVVGLVLALKIQMTAMPQLVAAFNGLGGGASAFVAGHALYEPPSDAAMPFFVATFVSTLIGAVTLSGSLVAFAKLQEIMSGQAIRFPGQGILNAMLAIVCLAAGVFLTQGTDHAMAVYWMLFGLALLLGVLVVIPIGGADMPVVISLLNSYSGIAAAATGFVINNQVLIVSGSLVGASGIILTNIMCKAMNRSLVNVLFGTMEAAGGETQDADEVYAGRVKSTSPDEVAMLFDTARRVTIVPGYGMAVAQCQHNVRDLANLLEERGITVDYAIHPVAGRMPGHMNVLLAEADVPYDKLREMDEINPTLGETDVAIVIGANDVVNPVARDPNSVIAGMPIIDVDKARTVVVIKRSLSPGFAGIPNPLFAADNTLMLFGDGKKAIVELVAAVKEAG